MQKNLAAVKIETKYVQWSGGNVDDKTASSEVDVGLGLKTMDEWAQLDTTGVAQTFGVVSS